MPNQTNETARGIAQMIAGALAFGVMAIFVKYTAKTLSSIEIVFFRSFLGTIAIAGVMWKGKTSWIGKDVRILFLRGITGFAALSLHFYAIAHLNLGTAVILNYTAPIYVVILARICLKERTTPFVNAMILISFIGLYLLVGPQFSLKPVPIVLGIVSGILAAVAYVLIRFNSEDESPYTIIFYFTAISTVGSLPLMSFGFFKWPNGMEWLGLLGVTAGAFFGQVWLTKAIQSAPVSLVLPFSYLTPVFASVMGALLWQEQLGLQAMIGGGIIVACGVLIYFFRQKTPFIPIEE